MKQNDIVLHITHTDVITDSRILKEIKSLTKSFNVDIIAIGVSVKTKKSIIINNNAKYFPLSIKLNKYKFLSILHKILFVFELNVKILKLGIKTNPTIIHCHDVPCLPVSILISKIKKSKLIYDAHELESNRNGTTKISGIFTFYVEKILWSKIDGLIVVSDSIKKWYNQNIGFKETEIILNAPIINNKNFKDDNYLRDKFKISKNDLIFVYVGILMKGRGIDLILETFKDPEIKSHIIFLGYGDYEKKIYELTLKHNNIHIHKPVPHDEVVSVLKSADIGLSLVEKISLSDYYCLPNKLFEYIFSGIPVLSSNFPDIKYYVEKYNLGKTCELSVDKIKKEVLDFENEKIYKIDESRIKDLSWETQEIKLNKFYNKIRD